MSNDIMQMQELLFELHNNGVEPRTKYFRKHIEEFKRVLQSNCNKINYSKLLLNIYNMHKLTKSDMVILQYIIESNYVVFSTTAKIYNEVKLTKSCVFKRLIILESEDIIKIDRYNQYKVIYFHPTIIEKWKETK